MSDRTKFNPLLIAALTRRLADEGIDLIEEDAERALWDAVSGPGPAGITNRALIPTAAREVWNNRRNVLATVTDADKEA